MPEKVHGKFDDGEESLEVDAQKDPGPQKLLASPLKNGVDLEKHNQARQTNGIKRHRDGSPKSKQSATLSDDSYPRNGFKASQYKNELNGSAFRAPDIKPKHVRNGLNDAKDADGGTYQNSSSPKKAKLPPSRHDLQRIAAQLEKTRKTLPIWSKKPDIRWSLRNHDILLLNGETGSGKSTQVPHFLYTEPWCQKKRVKVVSSNGREEDVSVGGMIAITQPRRVAAMTLAHRVAREIGSPLEHNGQPGKVGYSVRFESRIPVGTKIKFVTEGTLLQEMLRDPNLRQYSAVIVDEIHERSVDVDLICGFLRKLVHGDRKGRGGISLKVVLMSATLDLGGLEAFFARPQSVPTYQPGKNYGTTFSPHLLGGVDGVDGDLEADRSTDTFSSWEGIASSDEEESTTATKNLKPVGRYLAENSKKQAKLAPIQADDSDSDDPGPLDYKSRMLLQGIAENGVSYLYVEGRQYEVEILYNVNPPQDYLHDMLQTIFKIHITEPMPGDILAFLAGQEEIENLKTQIEVYGARLVKTLPKVKVMPLYGSLPAHAQQEVFEKLREPNTRKIVLATNIAETSVTVPGVRFVVDCGKSKVKQYRPRLGMESLLSKPISRVSAIQRAGRAGREAKGKCYRLYTEADYMKLAQDEKPEILRTDVIEAVLKMKARGVEDILSFPLMDSPDLVAMEKALVQLHSIGAIGDSGELTEAGRKIATFPLSAAYGRVLVAAAESEEDLLLNVIDIISCLTADTEIYEQPKSEEEREEVQASRREIVARESDVVTYLYTMQHYAAENTDRIAWCRKRLISTRGMKTAMSIRKQLRQICIQQKLLQTLPPPDPQPFDAATTTPKRTDLILKTFLKAFVTKTALLGPEGSYTTTQGRHTITIHPSSVLYGRKVEAIMFLENVFTAKNYAKRVSAVQADWIAGALGI